MGQPTCKSCDWYVFVFCVSFVVLCAECCVTLTVLWIIVCCAMWCMAQCIVGWVSCVLLFVVSSTNNLRPNQLLLSAMSWDVGSSGLCLFFLSATLPAWGCNKSSYQSSSFNPHHHYHSHHYHHTTRDKTSYQSSSFNPAVNDALDLWNIHWKPSG